MAASFQQRIADALDRVMNPRLGRSVVAGEMIHDIATTTDGRVRLTFLLSAADDATLVRDVRQALERVDGVTDVRIDVRDPAQGPGGTPARPEPAPRARHHSHSHGQPPAAGGGGRPG